MIFIMIFASGSFANADTYKLSLDLPSELIYDLTVTYNLPEGLVYKAGSMTILGASDTATEFINGPNDGTQPVQMTWSFGQLDNSANQDLSIQFQAVVADVPVNQDGITIPPGKATLNWKDGKGSIHTVSADSHSVKVIEPDLKLQKSFQPSLVRPGEVVTCTLSLKHGPNSHSDAYDVDLANSLPQGLTYLPGSMQIVSGPDGTMDASGLHWHFASMDRSWSGSSEVMLRYRATVDKNVKSGSILTSQTNLVWRSAPGSVAQTRDYVQSFQGNISITSGLPDLSISLADNPDPVRPGGKLNYTISYLNRGGYALGTAIVANYDSNLAFISSIPSPDQGTDNNWTLGDLDKDDSGIIRVTVLASSTLPDGSVLASSAKISSTDGFGSQASASTSVSNTAPLLVIEKSASDQLIRPGGVLKYTINYRNAGSSESSNVTVTDMVDHNLLFDLESSNPKPSKIWSDEQGTYLHWNASILGTEILPPDGSGTIEFTVSLSAIPEHPTFDWVYNNYKIDSDLSQGQSHTLETPVVHSLYVRKKADKEMYLRGETVNYTITYGNELAIDANHAVITDILPDVEFLEANPQPSFNNGSVLIWNIGQLSSKSSGTIQLYARINKSLTDIKFQGSQSVSGKGFVQFSQKLSTAREPKHLTNYVNITALYLDLPESDSSSASIGLLDALGTELSIQGHGSGSYSRQEETRLLTNNSSIQVKTSLSESYRPSSFALPRGREIGYSSKWSEAVLSKNRITDATTNERYMYASRIDRNSSLNLDKNGSTLISETSFEGASHIGLLKDSSINDTEFSRRTPTYDSEENYLGSFKVLTKFDEYGKSVTSSRSVNGAGFVAADKRITKSQRSYESGTGTYQVEDEVQTQTSYMAKDLNATFAPMSYRYTPDFKVDLSQKWKEGMWSKSGQLPAKGTNSSAPASFIGEEFSQADYLKKSTVAKGLNQMTTEAEFTGRARFQAAYDNVINESHSEAELYDEYIGKYKLVRNVDIGGVARFDEPHLSITKIGQKEPSLGTFVNYLITVTNDGNQALGPVYVMDLLPPGTEYVYSSARPSQINQNSVQWTLLNLGIGASNEIELKLNITQDLDGLVNRVQARGGYDDQWVSAENYSALQLGWLSCCPPQLLAAKEGDVDTNDTKLVHYRITLKNREKENMVATITDQLPAGMMYQNSSLTPSDYRSDRVSWNIVDLEPGEMRTIDYWARGLQGGVFVNQAHIEAHYLNGTDSAWAAVSSSVYVGGDVYSSSSSSWQPPACFGLNCTQQGFEKDWMACVSCGAQEPETTPHVGQTCPACTRGSGDDEGYYIPRIE